MTSGADAWLVDERWFKAYPLGADTTLGRGAENTIILRDPAVSRLHAEIKKHQSGYVLHTYGSSGTKLNGIRVDAESPLQESDVIEIAFTTLRFTMQAPTGEMFVVPRDIATSGDRHEAATRATLHAMHPVAIASRWRSYWHLLLGALLVIFVLAICAGR